MSPAVSAPVAVALGGSNGFPAVAKATMPAVVNISTSRVVTRNLEISPAFANLEICTDGDN